MAYLRKTEASNEERISALLQIETVEPNEQVRHWHKCCVDVGIKPWEALHLPAPTSGLDCTMCKHLTTIDQRTVATLHINYHSVKSHFTTENDKEIPGAMNIKLVDGPFRRLEGAWRFKALSDKACKVEFQLHYEFSSKLFEKVIGPVFNHIASTFVDAFVRRAGQVYGTRHG